ncbi:hypothetical protein G6L94_21865 [Agrobacterium rhizogenes]|nr:hypothetical protein [Rhizobium rhizogenes]NTI96346.1 hypothetical protein [Rhizobium rhizogenes]NTJ58817.1 hypothetical protein [Rhizobium rhizogenes]OCJ22405.1 hypothetical protein A6U89_32785 [Agrobacterium sp. B133/95]
MSTYNRLQLALKSLKGSDWQIFERLCSVFLSSEFPQLRTTANPGGDRGRDAELYAYSQGPNIVFQFSVQENWRQKIAETLKRLDQEFPNASHLVFLSNQEIGALGDGERADFIAKGRSVDIRDRNWFVERVNLDDNRRLAAEELARTIVDPLMRKEGVLSNAPGLKGQDARTALVYLEMQARDESSAKGLTKSSFEALVKCALRGTTAENRKHRDEIHAEIQRLLPQHGAHQLNPLIDRALDRLAKSAIKHWRKVDEYHLSFEEAQNTAEKAAGLELLNEAFQEDVYDLLKLNERVAEQKHEDVAKQIRTIIEIYFFRLGEEFAQCLTGKTDVPLHAEMLRSIVIENAPMGTPYIGGSWVDLLEKMTLEILRTPSSATSELLNLLSTSYTLFAFLSEVPDVQKATKKLFEHGRIWLDTTALLPLIAEQAFYEDNRPFTDLMVQLDRAGVNLSITEGVLEEVEGHLNLCKAFTRSSDWRGRVPYVYARYVIAGKSPAGFPGWLDNFMGDHRPIDDLADFFNEVANISLESVPSTDDMDPTVVNAVADYWTEVQDRRRRADAFSVNAYRLAAHDTENYLAALAERRSRQDGSALGYSSWLFTLDSAAWALMSKVDPNVRRRIHHAPLISLDFLLKYLSFGPRRDRVDTSLTGHSRIFTASIYESIPVELIAVAEQVRATNVGSTERLIQRRIRDELDKQRMAIGDAQKAGFEGEDAFRTML